MFMTKYQSPVGNLTLLSDGIHLTGLYIKGQRFFPDLSMAVEKNALDVFDLAFRWLDGYFSGKKPNPRQIPLNADGTPYRKEVWKLLMAIPFGETITYGELARRVNKGEGRKTCARAVGSAVGHNPISIIIPCHRVVGADGSLTGYAGGLDVKRKLLTLEQKFAHLDQLRISLPPC